MMDVASGPLAVPKDLLRTSLANCTAFRTWDGLAMSVEEAAARVHFDALPPPAAGEYTAAELQDLRPFAIVSTADDGLEFELEAAPRGYRTRGKLVVCLERNFPDASGEYDPAAAADRQFENMVGNLMRSDDYGSPGLLELSGEAGYLHILRMSMSGPYRVDQALARKLGDYQRCFLFVEWGRSS